MILSLILFSIGISVFGLLPPFEVITIAKVGTLNLGHVFLIFAFILLFNHWKYQRIQIKNPVFFALFILLLFIIFQSIRNILGGLGAKIIIGKLKTIYVFFYFIPFIMLIKSKYRLKKFIDILLIFGFINSLIMIYQFITGTELINSKTVPYLLGFYRVYNLGAFFVAMCLFIAISFFLNIKGKKLLSKMFIPFYIIAILTTLHRSLIIASMICIIIIVSINYFKKREIKVKHIAFISIIIISLFFLLTITEIGKAIDLRMYSGMEDMKYFEGTFAGRFYLLGFKFKAIINESPIMGIGFRYNQDLSKAFLDPHALSSDESYGNLFIFGGFIGLIVFLILYYSIANNALKMYNNSYDSYDKAIYLGILPLPILYLMLGFFSNLFFSQTNLTNLVTFTTILYLLNYFNELESNNTSKKI